MSEEKEEEVSQCVCFDDEREMREGPRDLEKKRRNMKECRCGGRLGASQELSM